MKKNVNPSKKIHNFILDLGKVIQANSCGFELKLDLVNIYREPIGKQVCNKQKETS